jgi:hypothetical protein
VCNWKREAIECRLRASFFEPGGVLFRECDNDQLVCRKGAKRVLDRFDRVGVTDPGLNIVGRCRLGKLVGPLGCVSARIVLGVCQPVQPRDGGGRRDDEHLRILTRVRTNGRAQIGRGDGGRGDDQEAARHGLTLSGSSTDVAAPRTCRPAEDQAARKESIYSREASFVSAVTEELGRLSSFEERHRRLLARLTLVVAATAVIDVCAAAAIYFLERHAHGTEVQSVGQAFLLHDRAAADGFLPIEESITPAGRALDVVLELWAVIVVAGAAGAIAAFFQNADSQ